MKSWMWMLAVAASVALAASCSAKGKHHDSNLPDPKSYNAHFGDMDTSGDGKVSWAEFKSFFPKTEQKAFAAIDLDKTGSLDHDEWHKFKEAHGLKHQE